MQVVVPSVSLAAMLQGAAFTVFVEMPSSATLSKPTSLAVDTGLPAVGAARMGAPAVGCCEAAAGAEPASSDSGVRWANTADELSANNIAKERVVFRIEPSFRSVPGK